MHFNLSLRLPALLCVAVLGCYTTMILGCGSKPSSPTIQTPASNDHDDHDHDDHDHDDHDHDDHEGHDHDDHEGHDHDSHEGHDHAAHGPNGGHMMELSGGAHAEWAHDDKTNQITVFVEKPETVQSVKVEVAVEGDVTTYDLEKTESDGKSYYQIVSPELLTAVKMGKVVDTKLVITTDDGQRTGQIEHHAH